MQRQQKIGLVTGVSSGIGNDIAKRLIKDRFRVYGAARAIEKMNDLAVFGVRPIRMDVSREEDIKAAVDTVLAETGGVDLLVNNAGSGLYGPVEDISPCSAF